MKKTANIVTGTIMTMAIMGTLTACSGNERTVELVDEMPVKNTAYTVTDYSCEFNPEGDVCDVVITVSGVCNELSEHLVEKHIIYSNVFEKTEFGQMKMCMASADAFSILAVLYNDEGECINAQTYFIEDSTDMTEFKDIEFVFNDIPDDNKYYLELKI